MYYFHFLSFYFSINKLLIYKEIDYEELYKKMEK